MNARELSRRTGWLIGVLLLGTFGCGDDTEPQSPDCSDPQGQPVAVELHTTAASQFLGTRPANVTWVAMQDASCAWQRVEGTQGQYDFTVKSGRYGVAVACSGPDANGDPNNWLSIFYLTPSEGTALQVQCFQPLPDSTPTHLLSLNLEESFPLEVRYWLHEQSEAVTLEGGAERLDFRAASGIHDVAAGSFQNGTLQRFQLWRDLDSGADNAVDIDVNDPGWITPGSIQVNTERKQGEMVTLDASYLTTHRTRIGLGAGLDNTGTAGAVSFQTPLVPAANRSGDEIHHFGVQATSGFLTREADTYLKDPGSALDLVLPDGSTGAGVSCVSASGCTIRFNVMPGAAAYGVRYLSTATPGTLQQIFITASAAYQGSAATLTFPDFSGVPGWNPSWGPVPSGSAWFVSTIGNNRGFAGELAATNDGHEEQPLAALDGITRWMVEEGVVASGS